MNSKKKGGPPRSVADNQPEPKPTNAQQQQVSNQVPPPQISNALQQNINDVQKQFGHAPPTTNAQQQQYANQAPQSLFGNVASQGLSSNNNAYVPMNALNIQQAPNASLFGNVSGGVYGSRQGPMNRILPQNNTGM